MEQAAAAAIPDNKPTYRVFCRAATDFSLAIEGCNVMLARADPSDPSQQWYKEDKFGSEVKDKIGKWSFSLVNKGTGHAIQHPVNAHEAVRLVKYEPDYLNESILWTAQDAVGDGFAAIRMVNNTDLNLDAFYGKDEDGYVHYGHNVGVWEWKNGDNQRWKIDPL